jgi:hypothetical protein
MTGLTAASTGQLWNWRANVSEMLACMRAAQGQALDFEAATMGAAGSAAVPFMPDELDRETWTRLAAQDPAAAYHAFDPASRMWMPLRGSDEALLKLTRADQMLVLQSLGLPAMAAEGIAAVAGSADGPPPGVGVTTVSARTNPATARLRAPAPAPASATGTVPFGSWNKPGNMPEPFYIGTAIHSAIGLYYESVHLPHAEYVSTNVTQVSSIVGKLAEKFNFVPGEFTSSLGSLKPDIFEISGNHFPSAIAYEIKPEGAEAAAAVQLDLYQAALSLAHVPAGAGPQFLPGTFGIVPAPDGWAQFNTPAPGIITYDYFKASREEVAARNLAEGRSERQSATWQRALVTLGWGAVAGLVVAMILLALMAPGGLLVLISVLAL